MTCQPRACASPMRGYFFCSECGAVMIRRYSGRGKHTYERYRCGSRWRKLKTVCRGKGIAQAALDAWAWAAVKPMVLDENALTRALAAVTPDELLADDLEAARREHGRAGRSVDALLSLARRDPSLLPHVEREAARERGDLRTSSPSWRAARVKTSNMPPTSGN